MADRIRVYAVPGQPPVQFRSEDGELVRGRWIARERTEPFLPLAEGEEVVQTVEVLKDIRRGHLATKPPPSPSAMFEAAKGEV